MAKLQFISSTLQAVKPQRTYWKERWYDQWTLMSPKLWCNSAEWSAAPSLPVAELHWRYGIALEPGQHKFAARFKEVNRLRMYVKVEYDTFPVDPEATDPLRWYGSVEIELDDFHGALQRTVEGDNIAFATGKNFFTCYGMEKLLDTAYVTNAFIRTSDGGLMRVNRALAFNSEGIPNMSPVPGPDGVYVFHHQVEGAGTWNSYAAASYLLKYHSPKDFNGQTTIPFTLGGVQLDALSPFDTVYMDPQDKTVRELLNSLMPRQRLTGWSVRPEDQPGGNCVVTPFTMTAVTIPLDNPGLPLWMISANPYQYRIAAERDRGSQFHIKRSTADAYDQVIVRGARRTSTATFSFYDGTLAKGWSADLETEFEQGAILAADYPPAGEVEERIYRNDLARATDHFLPVYRRFVLPPNFQYLVGDGLSGTTPNPLAPSDADISVALPFAAEDLRFTVELALQQGIDYETLPPVETSPPPHVPVKPLVFYPRFMPSSPGSELGALLGWRYIDTIGTDAESPERMDAGDFWSALVKVDGDGSLWVEMRNEKPEAFASADFTDLPDCAIDPGLLGYANFRFMLCTLTVEWSEYATGIYPPTGAPGRDVSRTLTVTAGEEFRCDYLCPQTVVRLRPETGELVRTSGGFFRDNRPELATIAKVGYSWYSQTRRAVTFRTSLLNSSLQIGSYITAIGDDAVEGDVHTEDVNSVITSFQIDSPSEESTGNPETSAPTIQYETAFGELDFLKFR